MLLRVRPESHRSEIGLANRNSVPGNITRIPYHGIVNLGGMRNTPLKIRRMKMPGTRREIPEMHARYTQML